MKRIFLFVATNLAIMITLSIVLSLLGFTRLPHGGRPRLRGADGVLAGLGLGRRVHLAADVALDGQDARWACSWSTAAPATPSSTGSTRPSNS